MSWEVLLICILQWLGRIGFNTSLNVQLNSPMKSSDPGLFIVGIFFFLITDQIPLLIVGIFRSLFCIESVLVVVLSICPFHLGYQIYWCTDLFIVHSILISFLFLECLVIKLPLYFHNLGLLFLYKKDSC
jgi:hypothetical protein